MTRTERLRQLPGYFAFNAGVMFFIGLASRLTSEVQGVSLSGDRLRIVGFAVLLAVLAIAAGFASVARIEFAKRQGMVFSIAWIAPAVAVGLPIGRAVAAGTVGQGAYLLPAIGVIGALAGMAWLALRLRQEIKA
jgi:hypothetical protein